MKGSVMDMIGVLLLTSTAIISLFMMFYLLGQFKTTAATIPMIGGNAAAMGTIDSGLATLQGMDSLLILFVFGVCIVAIISAFMLPTHPVLFIVAFILTLILIPISANIANMIEALYTTGPLAGTEVNFPISVLILNWLPKITAIMSFVIGAVMYGRSQGGGGY